FGPISAWICAWRTSRSTLFTAVNPAKSLPRPRAVRTTRGPDCAAAEAVIAPPSTANQRTAAGRRIKIGLLTGDGRQHVEIVPFLGDVARGLHLQQIDIRDHPPIRRDLAAFGKEILDR